MASDSESESNFEIYQRVMGPNPDRVYGIIASNAPQRLITTGSKARADESLRILVQTHFMTIWADTNVTEDQESEMENPNPQDVEIPLATHTCLMRNDTSSRSRNTRNKHQTQGRYVDIVNTEIEDTEPISARLRSHTMEIFRVAAEVQQNFVNSVLSVPKPGKSTNTNTNASIKTRPYGLEVSILSKRDNNAKDWDQNNVSSEVAVPVIDSRRGTKRLRPCQHCKKHLLRPSHWRHVKFGCV